MNVLLTLIMMVKGVYEKDVIITYNKHENSRFSFIPDAPNGPWQPDSEQRHDQLIEQLAKTWIALPSEHHGSRATE